MRSAHPVDGLKDYWLTRDGYALYPGAGGATTYKEVEEPNYGARESWMNEMYQMKAYLEDEQIYITERLKARDKHKVEQLATNEMFAGKIGTCTQGEHTELPEHPVDSTGYLADDDDESDWDWNSETGDGPTSPVSVLGQQPHSFQVTAQDIPLPYSFTVGGLPAPTMGYPIEEYPNEATQLTRDVNSI
ncbi:hypothetical protein L1987_08937 [Smallanthus sonchifolius]|uniref:Uncharacterized protein n=1 Tax=Smallanthus sonchifolius TaxID=185202 RepID=A0ACB9JNS1_9ASTR|nr:hypothetical protein L1987_08937 [Smallanthus sonchifolius]